MDKTTINISLSIILTLIILAAIGGYYIRSNREKSETSKDTTNRVVTTNELGTDTGEVVVHHQYWEFIDPDTGVHYICWKHGDGAGMTPRLNADGTVMVGD